jgi:hypothetical protein
MCGLCCCCPVGELKGLLSAALASGPRTVDEFRQAADGAGMLVLY